MNDLRGRTAILTGANGGIGPFIARALATEGVHQLLVAYPGAGLSEVCSAVQAQGSRAHLLDADLREPAERVRVVDYALRELGAVDLLVNNAGVEYSAPYHELPAEKILEVLQVNLEAPMMLTHLVLPEMLRRRSGHIVNISSLAGKCGPGYQEPYAATKAALTAFTLSLRGTYRGAGVSASVVCPGFVEAGIYARLKAKTGVRAPGLLAACRPERVAGAVVRAVRRDLPELIVSRYPVRPLLALMALSPSLAAWLTARLGVHDFFQRVVEAQKRGRA
jgi:short-subunit dehydrogenase